LDDLRWAIYDRLEGERTVMHLRIPQAEGKLLSDLYRVGEILSTAYEGNDVFLEIKLSLQNARRILPGGRYRIKR
jgi:50S ribosomal subunit-associated GTPase HflX